MDDMKMLQMVFSVGMVLLVMIAIPSSGSIVESDLCETLETELYVTREKTVETDGEARRLICGGTIMVKKCEGLCKSHVQPSVVHYPGFKKSCQCCRERTLKNRLVTLNDCFEGSKKVSGQVAHFIIKEPADCACYDCAI